ncbi:MAG TPA: hypothetical protein VGD06_05680 [Acidobacteriota bacterium]
MHSRKLVMVVVVAAVLAMPAVAAAQDGQIGQQGAVWNLGELAPRTYPSTVTAANASCPGAHDFHISLQGEAADFLVIVGPTVLTDISPGENKTSDVVFDLRSLAPGPHNQGQIAVRCVDCPVTCSQDYDLLAVHLTVTGDGNSAPPAATATPDPLWSGIDLTLIDPTTSAPPRGDDGPPDLRWVVPEALDRMTSAQDAVAEDLADLVFHGTGHAAGGIFALQITRNAETPFEMGFALGTLLVPDDARYSPMMVADNGAVALLEEVSTVIVSGYLLDPNRQLPPTAAQINGGEAPGWSVQEPPASGPFAGAVRLIEAGYELAAGFSTAVPVDNYFQVVVQRAIWAEADSEDYDQERLRQDILAQIGVVGKVAEPQQVENAADAIWNDLSQVANLGKAR